MTPPTPHKNWILSIDFGSTSSVVVASGPDRAPSVVEVDGERSVPSVVFVDEDETLVVGTSAVHLGRTRPRRAVRSPKRRLGNRAPIVIGGAAYSSVTLSAAIIRHAAAEAIRQQGTDPSEVRLTFPAMWGSGLRTRLIDAAHEAGLEAVRLIPEPIAAAFGAPGTPNPGDHLAIYDLGGGTFDTALLRANSAGFEVVGRPLGTDSVGGELLDEVIMQEVGGRLDPELWDQIQVAGDPEWAQSATQFLAECRRVKEAVSSHAYGEIRVATAQGMVHERVTTEEVEAMVAPHLTETIDLLRDVSAGVNLTSIQLVGGGSRMPLVHKMVTAAFPNIVVNTAGDPRVTVALGAAAATHEAGSTQEEEFLSPTSGATPLPDAAPVRAGTPLPDAAPVFASDPAPVLGDGTLAERQPLAAPGATAGRVPGGPTTLPEAEPVQTRGLPKVLIGSFAAIIVLALGSMMAYSILNDGAGSGGETATNELGSASASDSADTASDAAIEEADPSTTLLDSGTDESVDTEDTSTDVVTPENPLGRFVTELGPNLDGTGTYIVTTTDIDACIEGDLALRDDATGEVGPTLAVSSINSVLSEGPQGLIALVEECDGRFSRLRFGSQLSGQISEETFDDVELSPMPTRLKLLTFDFVRQVPVGHGQFADSGDSWIEIQFDLDGNIEEIGPSASQPMIELSSEGLTIRDQLTGEVTDNLTFGENSDAVIDVVTTMRVGTGSLQEFSFCSEYLSAEMDGITLTFFPTGEFVGWFLRPDPEGPALATGDGFTLGTTVAELLNGRGDVLVASTESGIGGYNIRAVDAVTGTEGTVNGFALDNTGDSELLELQAGQNCPGLVAAD